MAYWNHFAEEKFDPILFKEIEIGQKFRVGLFKGKRRSVVIAEKTGMLTYVEVRSKTEHYLLSDEIRVYKL
jgi:hypothetical protein